MRCAGDGRPMARAQTHHLFLERGTAVSTWPHALARRGPLFFLRFCFCVNSPCASMCSRARARARAHTHTHTHILTYSHTRMHTYNILPLTRTRSFSHTKQVHSDICPDCIVLTGEKERTRTCDKVSTRAQFRERKRARTRAKGRAHTSGREREI